MRVSSAARVSAAARNQIGRGKVLVTSSSNQIVLTCIWLPVEEDPVTK